MKSPSTYNTFVPKTAETIKPVAGLFVARWQSLFPKILARADELQAITWTCTPQAENNTVRSVGKHSAMQLFQRIEQRRITQQPQTRESINLDFPLDNSRLYLNFDGRFQYTAFHHESMPPIEVGKTTPEYPEASPDTLIWSSYEAPTHVSRVTGDADHIAFTPIDDTEESITRSLERTTLNQHEQSILHRDGAYAAIFHQVKNTLATLTMLGGEDPRYPFA